jgi:hypothetical protein
LADKLATSTDLSATRILGDQELRDAIDELHRSTQAITRHTETLKQQQDTLNRLVNARQQGRDARGALEAARARRLELKRSDLATAVRTDASTTKLAGTSS